ncbi:MAG: hypothetical protein ABIA12_01700 [Candidatus Aenigmatarchaeota archaeon]
MADVPVLPKVDEFAFVLLAGMFLIGIFMFAWTTPEEGAPLVADTSFSLLMKPGETETFSFVVIGKTKLTALNLTSGGEMASWIKFNKNNFDVADQATVTVTVRAPLNITNGLYLGRVTITGNGGRDTFSINVEISDQTGNKTSRKALNLGDFTVSYAKGTDTLVSKRDVQVSAGYLSSHHVTLTAVISDEMLDISTAASVDMVVGGTNGAGNLIVIFNDNELYNGAASEGQLSIPVSKSALKGSNLVTIKAAAPGLAFWSSTTYDLQSAKLMLSYDGAAPQTFDFTMSADQVSNFKRFALFYSVKDDTVAPVPDLKIKINNQIVYWKVPPLAYMDTTFKEDMFGNELNLNDGDNTITFSFDKNAYYSVSDAALTIEYYE